MTHAYEKVYIDMDGVLADFDTHARQVLGADFDVIVRTQGANRAWEKLWTEDPDFFAKLPTMPGMISVVKYCYRMSRQTPVILTAPCRVNREICMLQKKAWIVARFRYDIAGAPSIIFKSEKHVYSGPGRLLIDDSADRYREKWQNRGGEFYHFTGFKKFEEFANRKLRGIPHG